jgi:3-methyladenine DNA glycosylase AlkD
MIEELCSNLKLVADKDRSIAMAKYMKDNFKYFGIPSEKRKEIQRSFFQNIKGTEPQIKRKIVLDLWNEPERECQYVALDYIQTWPKKEYKKEDVELIYFLLTHKSWWDSVDGIASNFMGKYFSIFPEEIDRIISKWRNDPDMWVRRACLLFQLKYGADTNFELLRSLIDEYNEDKQFFIQKAIGWTLRQYSKFEPDKVRDFADQRVFGTVAKREIYKYI